MVQPRHVEAFHRGNECAGLWFGRAVDDLTHTRVHERADAHETRLDGDVYGGVRQTVVADRSRSPAQHEHFRVSGGIDGANRLVERARDDAIADDEYRTDRHFARLQPQPRLIERGSHEVVTHHWSVGRAFLFGDGVLAF